MKQKEKSTFTILIGLKIFWMNISRLNKINDCDTLVNHSWYVVSPIPRGHCSVILLFFGFKSELLNVSLWIFCKDFLFHFFLPFDEFESKLKVFVTSVSLLFGIPINPAFVIPKLYSIIQVFSFNI